MNKRLSLISSIAFIGVVSLAIGLFTMFHESSVTPVSVLVGNTLSVDFLASRDANLIKAKCMSDDDGFNSNPVNFTVTNLREDATIYNMYLEEDSSITDRLSKEFIKISVIKNEELIVNSEYLNSFGKDLNILSNLKIDGNSTDEYRIYLWLDSNSCSNNGLNFKSMINVEKIDLTEEEAKDTTSPVIKLNGEQQIVINQNEEFVDPGILSITDDVDGIISTDNVTVKYLFNDGVQKSNVSFIDTSKVGNYYITYSVKDRASNESSIVRIVSIKAVLTDNTNPDNNTPGNVTNPSGSISSNPDSSLNDLSFATNVTYSTQETTSQDVVVTITSDVEMSSLVGWTLSSDKKSMTSSFSTNVNTTIIVFSTDLRTSLVNININNIDKTMTTKPQDKPLPTATPGNVSLSLSTTSTSNSIAISLDVKNSSDVASYSYMCGDNKWIDGINSTTYNCTRLIQNTSYKIAAKAVTKSNLVVNTTMKTVKTSSLNVPIITSTQNGLAESRDVSITYNFVPGYSNYYKIDNSEEIKVDGNGVVVKLKKNGTLTAITRDNNNAGNEVSSSYVESAIDSEGPKLSKSAINLIGIYTNGAAISWDLATDDFAKNITYSVCISNDSSVSVDSCINNRVAVFDNTSNYTFNSLNENATYYAGVVATDDFNHSTLYNVLTFTTGLKQHVWGEHFEISNKKDLFGINFSTWFDYMHNKSSGIYNVTNILSGNGSWGNVGDFHYWGEPAKGYYNSTDKAVIREQMTELAAMGVDFIIIDNTNAATSWFGSNPLSPSSVFYQAVYAPMKALLDTMVEMRNEGLATPYVVNWVSNNEGYTVMNVIDNLFVSTTYDTSLGNEKYSNLWVYWDNKPFYLFTSSGKGSPDRDVTYRVMWGLQPSVSNGEWSYLQKDNSKNIGRNANGDVEQVSVSVAMQQTRMSNTYTAVGRNHGITFYNQWVNAFRIHPKIITLTWWNEWGAERLNTSSPACGTYCFTDNYNQEYSRDIEPQKGGLGSTYYDWAKLYIAAYKNQPESPRFVEPGY